jgi:chorismate dehydratase
VTLAALRVGRLPFLNAHPFHAGWSGPEPRWVTAPPRRLGQLASRGRLDAALLASRDALALRARFRPLADLGIACRGPVASVLLLSWAPAGQLSGARIALSEESRTSRALLRILLATRHRVRGVEYVPGTAEADARLLIGDAALRARAAWPHALDLGAEWTAWTGLPFVYARWVVRHDLPAQTAGALAAALGRALDRPEARRPAGAAAGLSPAGAGAYLDRFVYRLGPAELAGLGRFHEELDRHALHRFDPIRFPQRLRQGSAA